MKEIIFIIALISLNFNLNGQIVLNSSFDPAGGGNCAIAHDECEQELWIYTCFSSNIDLYDFSGNYIRSIPFPGSTANDVDLDIAPVDFTMSTFQVSKGDLLVFNGEGGFVEIYALDKSTGTIIATLNTQFGDSHVVGGAYHPIRNTFFVVQDDVPSSAKDNIVAEIDPISGAPLDTIDLDGIVNVSFGDLDISNITGNLFIVSSDSLSVQEIDTNGSYIQNIPFPSGVTSASGISMNCETGNAWTVRNLAFSLGGFECGPEDCDDGIDNNNNGVIDENIVNYWTGPVSGFWNADPCNWSLQKIPKPCDNVIIDQNNEVIIETDSIGKGSLLEVKLGSQLSTQNNAQLEIINN